METVPGVPNGTENYLFFAAVPASLQDSTNESRSLYVQPTQPDGSRLQEYSSLVVPQSLKNFTTGSTFVKQGDGNLILYNPSQVPLWASRTSGDFNTYAVLQGDGNFVIYDNGRPLWASGTGGASPCTLHLQGDNNVLIYGPSGPVWATNTAGR